MKYAYVSNTMHVQGLWDTLAPKNSQSCSTKVRLIISVGRAPSALLKKDDRSEKSSNGDVIETESVGAISNESTNFVSALLRVDRKQTQTRQTVKRRTRYENRVVSA